MSDYLKQENIAIIILIVVCLIVSVAMISVSPKQKGKVYDCSLAEISPDYPPKVKEECRKLRAENFNKDLQKPK
jgi:hypothetical protein